MVSKGLSHPFHILWVPFDILYVVIDVRALSMRGYRHERAEEQIAMKITSKKIVFRLKHSCLVHCYDLWSVGPFDLILLTFSRFFFAYSKCVLT